MSCQIRWNLRVWLKIRSLFWVSAGRMGIYLSSPKTEKECEDGGNGRLRYGLSSMQGWRMSMEDAVSTWWFLLILVFYVLMQMLVMAAIVVYVFRCFEQGYWWVKIVISLIGPTRKNFSAEKAIFWCIYVLEQVAESWLLLLPWCSYNYVTFFTARSSPGFGQLHVVFWCLWWSWR